MRFLPFIYLIWFFLPFIFPSFSSMSWRSSYPVGTLNLPRIGALIYIVYRPRRGIRIVYWPAGQWPSRLSPVAMFTVHSVKRNKIQVIFTVWQGQLFDSNWESRFIGSSLPPASYWLQSYPTFLTYTIHYSVFCIFMSFLEWNRADSWKCLFLSNYWTTYWGAYRHINKKHGSSHS